MIVARGSDGGTAIYAPAENIHRDGILAVSIIPSPHVTPSLETDLVAATLRIAHALDYVGVLCVEFFVVRDPQGGLRMLVNEIAPRPHNSGHYTIDACITSQFAQQARIAAGLPLGDTRRHGARRHAQPARRSVVSGPMPPAMLREATRISSSRTGPPCAGSPRANLHLYAKREARRGRKMGHVTIVACEPAEAARIAREVAGVLGIDAW